MNKKQISCLRKRCVGKISEKKQWYDKSLIIIVWKKIGWCVTTKHDYELYMPYGEPLWANKWDTFRLHQNGFSCYVICGDAIARIWQLGVYNSNKMTRCKPGSIIYEVHLRTMFGFINYLHRTSSTLSIHVNSKYYVRMIYSKCLREWH